MQYLKSYKIFESSNITEWSDIKEIINVVSDEFDFEFKELKVSGDLVSFIFTGKEYDSKSDKKNIYKWFIDKILGIGEFVQPEIGVITIDSPSQITNMRAPNYRIKLNLPEEFFIYVYTKKEHSYNFETKKYKGLYEYHFNFKGGKMSLLDYVIENPEDKDLLKESNPSVILKELFQYYCKRSFYDIDFNILSVFPSNDKLLAPVKNRDISLPYNLSEQFKIDITPIFLEKVYKASGFIFRLEISIYDLKSVTNPDRLRGHSIAQETDEKLKELGIDMTWKDIFIIEE